MPDDDRVSYTREDLLASIKVALGARAAEELVYGTVTTGAESDLQQLTQIARSMVGRWGMSDAVGLATVLPAEGQAPLLPGASETSEATQRLVDEEVRRLLDDAHREVVELLSHHGESLKSLRAALLANETLDEHDDYAAAGVRRSAASPDRASLDSVWSSGEQPAAAGSPADHGRSVLPTTLPTQIRSTHGIDDGFRLPRDDHPG